MDTHLQPPPLTKARGHVRVTSEDRRRMASLRRSSQGPLDAPTDPLSSPPAPTSPSSKPSSPASAVSRSKSPNPLSPEGPKDFAFLLNEQNFLPIPTPLNPLSPPSDPSMPILSDLLRQGAFHTAALVSGQLITSMPPNTTDSDTIFQLWFIRLSCLVILGHTKIAATESKCLGDLTSSFYHDVPHNLRRDSSPNRSEFVGRHLVPWPLRVLAVRLQALGFGEWRRGIMAYYALAEEARFEATKAEKEGRPKTERRMWIARLSELGVLVASACVEMGDGEAAGRHLSSLTIGTGSIDSNYRREICLMEALVWLKIGDVGQAKVVLEQKLQPTQLVESEEEDDENDFAGQLLKALITTCDGDMELACKEWEKLHEDHPDDGMVTQNLAVCYLYTGRLVKSKTTFEKLVNNLREVPAFQPLLFNMATVYELSTDKAQSLKLKLADRVALNPHQGLIKERSAADFKLEGLAR